MRQSEAKKEKKVAYNPSDKTMAGKQPYHPDKIEKKWQEIWEGAGLYEPDMSNARRPFYNLMMFPYPSAEGLHVGGIFTFGGVDTYGRFQRMRGNDVFEPMGLDGFGINAENHAIKTDSHPIEHAKRTEENFYRQLRATGNGFAWKHKVETYDPHYYKWTQWLFTELFKAGLAYRKAASVNFCPWCKTVLADEQVIDGKCERCSSVVEKKNLEQWFFRITEYAERLLGNIEGLDWTEKVKIAQRNWIGKKEGAKVKFSIKFKDSESEKFIEVFTTRPDTLYGVTFLVISPEHGLVEEILRYASDDKKEEIRQYIALAKSKSEIERQAEGKEKTGVFSGTYVKHPITGEEVPVWIADYVLMGYGTGAVMGVPAHDARDFEFAKKFGLSIKMVVKPHGKSFDSLVSQQPESLDFADQYIKQVEEGDICWTWEGLLVNSDEWNGFDVPLEKGKVIDWLEEKEIGEREVNYHLRDWLISRQRYWGPPIPMIYCKNCAEKGQSWFNSPEAEKYAGGGLPRFARNDDQMAGWYPVERNDLPVRLPFVEDYKPLGTGESPLASYPEFYKVKCPVCGGEARRETDVSDTFLDSSWYFLRYISPDRDDVAFDEELAKKWLPVHMYIGGAEHSVLHLLYSRFVTMVLSDLGHINFEEPFKRFYAHGLIIKDGAKMSKSKGNVINPDEYVKKYGADTLRMYLLFLGPFSEGGDFRDTGIEGMSRFLKRVWKLFSGDQRSKIKDQRSDQRLKMMHQTIKGVTEDMEHLRFNTGIAKLMTYYNFLAKFASNATAQEVLDRDEVRTYLQLLAPFAPHMAEELWEQLELGIRNHESGIKDKGWSVHTSGWPGYDAGLLVEDVVEVVVQVNGKVRSKIKDQRSKIQDQKEAERLAREDEVVKKFLDGKVVRKVIYVPGKILNFVIEN